MESTSLLNVTRMICHPSVIDEIVLQVARLDALSARYKSQSEELERSEEELKMEKRKLQREVSVVSQQLL